MSDNNDEIWSKDQDLSSSLDDNSTLQLFLCQENILLIIKLVELYASGLGMSI